MPKEIYIDENGNERILSSSPSALSGLLDTDITTPSANQVLAYNGSKWGNVNLTSTPTITPNSAYNVSVEKNSSGKIGEMVFIACRFNINVPNGGWSKIASTNVIPVDEVRTIFVLSATSTVGGTVRINASTGDIEVMTLSAISGANIEVNMCFRATA